MDVFESFMTLIQMLLGRVDYVPDLVRINTVFGLLYFIAYIIIMFIIFVNVFLAILGEAYTMVREKMDEERAEQEKANRGRRKRTMGDWVKLLRAYWKARKARKAKAAGAGADKS